MDIIFYEIRTAPIKTICAIILVLSLIPSQNNDHNHANYLLPNPVLDLGKNKEEVIQKSQPENSNFQHSSMQDIFGWTMQKRSTGTDRPT